MKEVLETLDQLAVALTKYNHTWTKEERKNYEQSIRYITETPDKYVEGLKTAKKICESHYYQCDSMALMWAVNEIEQKIKEVSELPVNQKNDGLDIQQALLAEKPLKRKNWEEFVWIRQWQKESRMKIFIEDLTIEDILANDWEIKV